MSDLIASDDPFTAEHKLALREIVGYMIPAGHGRPAASDDAIFREILQAAKPHAENIYAVLSLYADTDLQALSQMRNPVLSVLVSLTVQCYYRDDRVMQALEMEPRAPHPGGYEVEPGDWTLLDPVRARGDIYRDVSDGA